MHFRIILLNLGVELKKEPMTLQEIVTLLDAEVVLGQEQLDKTIRHAFAADLMSDVLRLDTSEMLLITGLANVQ